jgi:hypothetical protein
VGCGSGVILAAGVSSTAGRGVVAAVSVGGGIDEGLMMTGVSTRTGVGSGVLESRLQAKSRGMSRSKDNFFLLIWENNFMGCTSFCQRFNRIMIVAHNFYFQQSVVTISS